MKRQLVAQIYVEQGSTDRGCFEMAQRLQESTNRAGDIDACFNQSSAASIALKLLS
jgi:hypothetical protein